MGKKRATGISGVGSAEKSTRDGYDGINESESSGSEKAGDCAYSEPLTDGCRGLGSGVSGVGLGLRSTRESGPSYMQALVRNGMDKGSREPDVIDVMKAPVGVISELPGFEMRMGLAVRVAVRWLEKGTPGKVVCEMLRAALYMPGMWDSITPVKRVILKDLRAEIEAAKAAVAALGIGRDAQGTSGGTPEPHFEDEVLELRKLYPDASAEVGALLFEARSEIAHLRALVSRMEGNLGSVKPVVWPESGGKGLGVGVEGSAARLLTGTGLDPSPVADAVDLLGLTCWDCGHVWSNVDGSLAADVGLAEWLNEHLPAPDCPCNTGAHNDWCHCARCEWERREYRAELGGSEGLGVGVEGLEFRGSE